MKSDKKPRKIQLDLSIDKLALDEEWVSQPATFEEYAYRLANAERDRDEAKDAREVIEAETDYEVRSNPQDYGIKKISEKAIDKALALDTRCKEARQRVIESQHKVGILQAAVRALDQRKKALEKLVDLHGQSYFAVPQASKQSRELVEDMKDKAVRRRLKPRQRSNK